ncbi:MAG: DNRLRE domain-containing protein [Chloroflexi bacterium]|nr:DNRLRE domain-containing protein [Chloroflexota bacterium]
MRTADKPDASKIPIPLVILFVTVTSCARFGGAATTPAPGANPTGAAANPPRPAPSFTLVADTYVNESKPDANYGSAEKLHTDGTPQLRAYLRFRVQGVIGAVTRATLRVYATSSSSAGYDVRPVADNNWDEGAIGFANAPESGDVVGSSGAFAANTWTSVDVTPIITGDGTFSLALTSTSTTATTYASREAGANAPQLVVEFDGDSPSLTAAPGTAQTRPSPSDPIADVQPTLPTRAAFYYAWFPEAWSQKGISPFTNFSPALGIYDSSDAEIIRKHIEAMEYAHIEVGIASWWGQGTPTDQRTPALLTAASDDTFRWSVYYEAEGRGNPSAEAIRADLTYLRDRYGSDPGYFRINGRFVVFVFADADDKCEMADRWKQANTVNAYVVLKVFHGYRDCASQPDGWHQYAPAEAADAQGSFSYSISPGYWKGGEAPRLDRDLERWKANIRDMIASDATFQLITTFNEWGEGSAIEAANEWKSDSGYGAYLDALANNGTDAAPPSPVATAADATPRASDVMTAAAPILVGAGDIAGCGSQADEATASLIDGIPGIVFAIGDTVYDAGTPKQFAECYDPSWGRFKSRTRPAVGNHEYLTPGASGYFDYFGASAGRPGEGYYSYDFADWHVVVVNSNCSQVGGCGAGSAQEKWLRNDLAAHPSACALAYWHHPRFSSGQHGNFDSMEAIWQALYDAGAEVVLGGHDHDYERFAPQDPKGSADPARGIREFVVGTGGRNLYSIPGSPIANSETLNDSTFGVLKLTLHPTSYDWEFIPAAGGTFTDSGSGNCH